MPNNYKLLQIHSFKNYLLIVLSLLATVVLIWTVTSLVTRTSSVTLPQGAEKAATVLNPALDTTKLEKLSEKQYVNPEDLKRFPINIIITDDFSKNKTVRQIQPN